MFPLFQILDLQELLLPIKIRGTGTINNSNPYVIIDGAPGDFNDLNSADIKSIEVLKDASATAIYGSNGANGVIIVTTNGGKKGKAKVTFNSYIGTQERQRDLDMLNSQDWAMLVNEGSTNDGAAPLFTDPEVAAMNTYDWGGLIYRTGYQQNNQLAVSGGNDFASYYVSYGYTKEKGILKSSSFDRHNLRINNDYKINKNITLGHKISYFVKNRETRNEGGDFLWSQAAIQGYGWEPYIPFYDENGGYSSPRLVSARHPDAEVLYGTNETKNRNFSLNAYLDVNFLQNFNFRTTYAPNYSTEERYDFDSQIDPDGIGYSVSGGLDRNENKLESKYDRRIGYTWSNVLTYKNTFADKHNVTLMVGQEQQEFTYIGTTAASSGISDLIEFPVVNNSPERGSSGGNRYESNLYSTFSRLLYSFDDRYSLTATVRRDGSSKFGTDKRYGTFPAGAVAWNIHNEKFMENNNFFNRLKIRAGLGEIGNRSFDDFEFFNKLSIGPDQNVDVVFGDTRAEGAFSKSVSNPSLQWESTVTSNIGIDLGFLNNKFNLSVDYFDRQTKDMIIDVSPETKTSGLTDKTAFNLAQMSNKGLEFSLGYNQNFGDFGISVNANVDVIENELKSLRKEGQFLSNGGAFGVGGFLRTEAGFPVSYFYGLQTDGVFQNPTEVTAGNQAGAVPGDIRYVDQLTVDTNNDGIPDAGNGTIGAEDRTKIGDPHPDFNYSFNIALNYKNWDFTAFFQGVSGNEIFSSLPFFFESELSSGLQSSALGRWHGEGTSNTLPRVSFTDNAVNTQISDRYVYNGSYLKLRNIQLGYNVPGTILDKIGLDQLRLYITGRNIFTITDYDIGFDPEIGTGDNSITLGLDRGRYPQPRTFLFGLNLTL